MRGSTVNCIGIISEDEIGSPLLRRPDAAIVMNQPSLNRFQPIINMGGLIVSNTSIIDPATCTRNGKLRSVWISAA